MKIHHISDSHSYHDLLKIDPTCDMIIHSGDFSNYRDVYKNEIETRDFIQWYKNLDIKYKILIAGNHDAVAAKWSKEFKQLCKDSNIIYLEHESVEIEGIKIFGSPYTPRFGDWYFMKQRHKLWNMWEQIPDDTDILVVHGPPNGCLDFSYKRDHTLECCGCRSLKKQILQRLNLKFCLFGHIHNNEDIINAGIMKLSICDTIFSNGSIVCDGKFGKLTSNGNILKYK